MIGRPVISSCSLRNVTTDPVKLTDPTTMVNAMAIRSKAGADPTRDTASSSTSATIAAAAPPTPLKSATSCGICVIRTRYAPSAPITVPTATAIKIQPRWSRSLDRKTITQASTAPIAPIRLPRRAVRGEDSPFRATMKHTAATR